GGAAIRRRECRCFNQQLCPLQMYMTSVLWSDHNEIVVYRTFQDFRKMHKQLKKAFPPGSKLNKADRIIPRFRVKKLKRSGKKKSPTRSLVRLKFLQKYCNELLSCEPRVSQSADLIQFFHPNAQDLEPEFSKNSVMIMPSEEEVKAEAGHGSVGNVTQPFVTVTYRCVSQYETKDTKNKPFKVAADEKVDVLIKDKAGWWLVENEEKRMAWFPAPYLEKLEEDGDEDDTDGTPTSGTLYLTAKNYKASKGDEISVAVGAVVEVLQKSDSGWWLIRYQGKVGYVPTLCLQPYNRPQQQSNKLSSSRGNLLQLPSAGRSPSPQQPHADGRQRSHSLNALLETLPAQPARGAAPDTGTPPSPQQAPPPVIRGPGTPKVPPRPQAQEILTRCTTITRKNASRGA
uniref:NADPH oxidase organizer 1a n=1 Tax=Tetraodon nigroviridis TaxID=99883 RepID=H3DKX9_TETNG